MARKRKLNSRSTESFEPQKKQQQLQKQQVVQEPKPQNEPEDDIYDEEEEEDVEEDEYDESEDEEDDSEDEEEGIKTQNPINGADEGDEEPIEKLLEPFNKDQLVNLLREAASKHRDVADRIRKVADEDTVHRKIFVHGLGWDTTAETLTNAFKQYGEIEDCKAVCDKVSGKSKGYGFILFKARSGARRALKQPQKKIGNRMAACQLASIGPVPAHGGVTGPVQAAQPHSFSEYTQKKIYVSNVGAELDPQKLYSFFSKFGEVEEGPLGLDKVTGKPRGFCLFVYKTAEGAKKALEEPQKHFEGNILHCQKAIDGTKPGKGQPQPQPQPQHQHSVYGGAQFHRNDNAGFLGGAVAGAPGHMMAPVGPGVGFNQNTVAAAQAALNPALGQALTALLATQGAGLGLTNLLGTLGTNAAVNPAVPVSGHGIQGAYGNQTNVTPGVMGGYGSQGSVQAGYPNQQIGQAGAGRGQPGVGQFGGTYMGN